MSAGLILLGLVSFVLAAIASWMTIIDFSDKEN